MDFCGKSSGLANFENTVDRGSAVIPDCARLMFGSWVINEIWIIDLSSALVGMLLSSNYFLFRKKLLFLELHYVIVMKYAAFFTIWTKLSVTFTCTNLLLNLYTSVSRCTCGFRFEQKFCQMDGFGAKMARIGGFAYPCSPPSFRLLMTQNVLTVLQNTLHYLRLSH